VKPTLQVAMVGSAFLLLTNGRIQRFAGVVRIRNYTVNFEIIRR
jgi:hypothetical protein